MGLLLITQDVADVINSKAGHAVLANSAYTLLLRQKPAIIDSIMKTFSLSDHEKDYLLTATKGAGIFIADNDHQEIKVIASPEEHKLITTNPNEMSPVEKPTVVKENLQPYYPANELTSDKLLALKNKEYVLDEFIPIGETRSKPFCVIKRANAGEEHSFYLANVASYLEEKGAKNIRLWDSNHPDITFENKSGVKFYIEIETGNNIRKNKKDRIEKFRSVESKYRRHIVVLLLDSTQHRKYSSITNIPVIVRKDFPQWAASCLGLQRT